MVKSVHDVFKAIVKRLEEEGRQADLSLSPLEGVIVLAQLQLALRHPDNFGPSAEIARKIARGLQAQLSQGEPELQMLLEAGWHTEFDVEWDK